MEEWLIVIETGADEIGAAVDFGIGGWIFDRKLCLTRVHITHHCNLALVSLDLLIFQFELFLQLLNRLPLNLVAVLVVSFISNLGLLS